MEGFFALPGILLALVLVPLGLFGSIGFVILVLKIATIVQKASEPPIEDGGHYSLDQSKDVGQQAEKE